MLNQCLTLEQRVEQERIRIRQSLETPASKQKVLPDGVWKLNRMIVRTGDRKSPNAWARQFFKMLK